MKTLVSLKLRLRAGPVEADEIIFGAITAAGLRSHLSAPPQRQRTVGSSTECVLVARSQYGGAILFEFRETGFVLIGPRSGWREVLARQLRAVATLVDAAIAAHRRTSA